MLTPTKDGVICDFCGVVYKDAFVYYSIQSTLISIKHGFRNQSQGPLDRDMCMTCYDNLTAKVKINLGPHKKGFIKCDLSKNYGNADFTYLVMNFDRIDVDRNRATKMTVDKQVIDLNVIKYQELLDQVESVRQKVANQGTWT